MWPLYLVPLVVIPSRLYQGAHHPTDVLASLVFAPIWVAVVAHVVLSTTRAEEAHRDVKGLHRF